MRRAPTRVLEHRLAAVRATFAERGHDALVVTHAPNIRYLTNHDGTAGVLVLTTDAAHLIVDTRYEESVRLLQASEAACPGLSTWPVPSSYDEALVDLVGQLAPGSVGFEAAYMTVAQHDWLTRALAERQTPATLSPTSRVIEQFRIVKDVPELAVLRDAAARLTPVAAAAFAAVTPGVAERAVAGAIEAALRMAGYERPAFDTIVASGPNAALPHHRAGDRLLQTGDVVVLDFGGVLDGYCCDLTRTVSVGPATAETARIYAAVREAQQAAIDAVKPGVDPSLVDAAARSVLERLGFGAAFGHGTGHGLGLEVHEEPRIGRPRAGVAAARLAPGMVVTIEPGAYLPGWGGVRIEDDVLVTGGGCEMLTSVTRELLTLS